MTKGANCLKTLFNYKTKILQFKNRSINAIIIKITKKLIQTLLQVYAIFILNGEIMG